MKTIFRSTIATVVFAAVIAFGAAATFAQDPCVDADGQTKLGDEFRRLYALKDIPNRKLAVDTGKQFLEKYGACDSAKDLNDYLKTTLPKMIENIRKLEEAKIKADRITRFNKALTDGKASRQWDEVYAAGKELLNNYDDSRVVEVVLGSIGLDETATAPRNTKWNDDTLKYAKLTIQDLESGKLTTFGIGQFTYNNKDDAIAWMNYTIGYILAADKDNKKEGANYLFKASQANSDTKAKPEVYKWIGAYYLFDATKLFNEVKALIDAQKDTDTPEVKKQKIDEIKAKIGVLNGTAERALDAYSRAWTLAPATPAGKAYRDGIYKTINDLYKVRFQKLDGLDAWVKAAPAKPMPDPSSVIVPIIDPDPTPTTTVTTTTTPGTTPGTKPPVTPTPKPAAVGKPGRS
jgi:hypothetical protein